MLLCVVAVIGLAYWFTRHVAGSGGLSGFLPMAGREHLKVLAQTALGKDQSLLVVAAGERYFLLGATPSQITKLAELTAEEAAVWQAESGERPVPPSFKDALLSRLGKKK